MTSPIRLRLVISLLFLCLALPTSLLGESAIVRIDSDLAGLVETFDEDRDALGRRYDFPLGEVRAARSETFYEEWRNRLDAIDFESLNLEGQTDWVLLSARVDSDRAEVSRRFRLLGEIERLLPFAERLIGLEVARRELKDLAPAQTAQFITDLTEEIQSTRKDLESKKKETPEEFEKETTPTLAHRAAKHLDKIQASLGDWYSFYDGYDPLFSWWMAEPYADFDKTLTAYKEFLRKEIVGVKEGEDPPIVGDPIGRQALLDQLTAARIPYSPEELQDIARKEFAWCEAEMLKASRELGFGDDWHAALEHVKGLHPEPGGQPALIRDLALEAIEFLEKRDLLTIPSLSKEVWRMEMMSPERQKVSPFFLGGEVILVSSPTNTMAHEDKLMSLRGNNEHFSRAVVHHELIPGHHLQGFVIDRSSPHRWNFFTPFWLEGWALYWEMRLWDMDFQRSPEDRVGMLFWRMHRCARILFSLGFHLGEMSPQESIELLVEKVGHERANATAEVRRSFEGRYGPLYQLAYMIGAIQFRSLHQELVVRGDMQEKEFHDRILRGGPMPVEWVRKRLSGEPLDREAPTSWRFAHAE